MFALSVAMVQAVNFTPGNLVVSQVGNGTAPSPTTNTVAVNLVEFAPIVSNPVGTVVSTTALTGITAAYASAANGQITRSNDGRYLILMGYDQAAGVIAATANAGNKIIARIAADKTVNLTTKFPTLVGVNAAISLDGSQFWMNAGTAASGTNANYLGYATLGQTTTPAYVDGAGPGRVAGFVANQLFTLRGFENIAAYTPSQPTSTVIPEGATAVTGTATKAIAVSLSSALSASGYVFFDIDPAVSWNGTGLDVVYVANVNSGLEKYYWNGNDWKVANSQYSLKLTALNGGSGYASTPTVTIGKPYAASTAFALNEVVKGTDNKCYRVATAGTTDATLTLSTATNVTIGTANFVFVGNTYPTATALVSGGSVTDVLILQGNTTGLATNFAPTITFTGGTPTVDATATIAVSNNAYFGPGACSQITGALNSAGKPVIYGIRGNGTAVANALTAITDASAGISSEMNGTNTTSVTLATAATGYAFRGVAFAPVANPSTSTIQSNVQLAKVIAKKGGINIQSANNQAYKIINTLGQTIAKGIATSDNQLLPVNAKGIVLVQINKQVTKVLLAD